MCPLRKSSFHGEERIETYDYQRVFVVHQIVACPGQTLGDQSTRKALVDGSESIGNVNPEKSMQKSDGCLPISDSQKAAARWVSMAAGNGHLPKGRQSSKERDEDNKRD